MNKSLDKIVIRGRYLYFPSFFPDGTRAVVRSLDSKDLIMAGVQGIIVNTYHLYKTPGDGFISKLGGVGRFMSWDGFTVSDSGGFQIMSMLYRKGEGRITKQGVYFDGSLFTPEDSIRIQFNLNTDIVIVLDYFTNPSASVGEMEKSVEITSEWARRSKDEYERQIVRRKLSEKKRPLLLAVIQGGRDKRLREKSARELLRIGFDGYGFGGWIIDESGKLDLDVAKFNAELTPDDKIRFALGVGKPEDIVKCVEYGYHLFDCVLPTRDARHKRLYVFKRQKNQNFLLKDDFYKFIYPVRSKYSYSTLPIDSDCDCFTCKNYSLSYLSHLFRVRDSLAFRLASIHNLRFYTQMIEMLRKEK